jgi:hypothetical protein
MPVTALRGAFCSNQNKIASRSSMSPLVIRHLGNSWSPTSKLAAALVRQAATLARQAATLARDWSVVAATIPRWSGRRSSVLDALFG